MTRRSAAEKANETFSEASEYAREASSKVRNIGEQVGSGIKQQISELDVDEATIPDAFRDVPKVIPPKVHAWLDFAVTTYFLGLGVWFAMRGKAGPATAAFVNGGMVAGVSMFTDYDGDGNKPISFKLHGTLDFVQATTAALGPALHGFADEPEAKYFYGQAANELGVIAMTDWDAGMPKRSRRRRAA